MSEVINTYDTYMQDFSRDPVFNRLSERDKLLIEADLLGYKELPPTIEEFLDSPYYLGGPDGIGPGLYPYWRKFLKEYFPDPLHVRWQALGLTGAIGCGKSFCSTIISLYSIMKLMKLKDPWKTLGMTHVKSIGFSYLHKTTDQAYNGFIEPILSVMDQVPFFQRNTLKAHDIALIPDGARGNATIGFDICGYLLSELAFLPEEIARYKLNQAFSRQESRFQGGKNLFTYIIIDSSAKDQDDIVSKFIRENPIGDQFRYQRAAIWEAKAHKGYYFNEGSFKMYAGDALHTPQILEDEAKISIDLDPDRILTCPMELYPNAKMDPILFLQDKAGISVMATNLFLPFPQHFIDSFKLPKLNTDVVTLDFYDKEDKILYKVENGIDLIPKESILYCHLDLALVDDICGLSIVHFKEWIKSADGVKVPKFSAPIIIGLSRREGQETPLYQILDFFNDLRDEGFTIGKITFDQFASAGLKQDLLRAGFNVEYLSVDRNDKVYNTVKSLIAADQVEFAQNERFKKEVLGLKVVDRLKGKIDHDPVGSYFYDEDGNRVPDKSKDLADSVFGSIYGCFVDLDLSSELASQKATKEQLKAISHYLDTPENRSREVFQNMVDNIW